MTTVTEADELKRLELTEIFHNTLLPIADLPALRALFDVCASDCASVLGAEFSLEGEVTVERTAQLVAYEALGPSAGMVGIVYYIAEWNAHAVTCFDRTLLFRALDSMYGGDGRGLGPPPARALTPLEQSIANQLAKAVVGQFQSRFAPYVSFGCALERVDEAFDPELFGKDRSELVVVGLRLEAYDERIVVALPVRGLELVRDQIAAPEEAAPVELDPNWSRSLEQSVARTEVELVAVAEGPPMLLGDIARLQPGSLVEFDAEYLEYVRIESDGEAIFEGKLGQSKGYLSVCIEAPLSPSAADEPAAPVQRRRA